MSNTSVSTSAADRTVAKPVTGVRAACAMAFMIGAGLVFMIGFANADVLHNAAHDSRHSLAFPCH